jgi:hypothetical protein
MHTTSSHHFGFTNATTSHHLSHTATSHHFSFGFAFLATPSARLEAEPIFGLAVLQLCPF